MPEYIRPPDGQPPDKVQVQKELGPALALRIVDANKLGLMFFHGTIKCRLLAKTLCCMYSSANLIILWR